jgi:membrane dipeptidase
MNPMTPAPQSKTGNPKSKIPLVVDLHCDSIIAHAAGTRDLRQRSTTGHLDIPRMKEGGVNGQLFAVWVDPNGMKKGEYVPFVERSLAALEKLALDAADDLWLVRSPDEFRAVTASGRIAAIAAVEGGHAIEGDLANLDRFYKLGVRALTITWCNSNELADGGRDKNTPHNGLSPLGRQAIRRMNALGMLVDVSHCSEKAFFDILDTAQAPVIASHSGAAKVHQFANRNLSDQQLKRLAQNGGMIGIVFLPAFLDPNEGKDATLADLITHIDHVCQLIGPNHVGLGSDFDGFEGGLIGLEDCSKMPSIADALRARNYPEPDITKILGTNFLRIWDSVTKAATDRTTF